MLPSPSIPSGARRRPRCSHSRHPRQRDDCDRWSELAVLTGQCLARRIADATLLETEVDAWRTRPNTHDAKANAMANWHKDNWHFTTADARVKLKSLYPAL